MVIAVIGIIAAIAIPAMAGIFGTAETNKTKRNAQNIANTFAGAKAVGNTTTFADKAAAVTAITQNGLSGVAGGLSAAQPGGVCAGAASRGRGRG